VQLKSSIFRRMFVVLPAAMLGAACGPQDSAPTGVTEAALTAEAPTSASVDLAVGDATGMSDTLPASSVLDDASLLAPTMDPCHPHLFARTAEVVWRLNAVFYRHLRHVEHLIARRATSLDGGTGTWTETGTGLEVQRQLTITADGGTYDFALALAPSGQTPPQWVEVLSGSTTKTSTPTGSDRVGSLDFDYDALRSVLPAEHLTGKVAVAFERLADSSKPAPGLRRTTTVTFTGFSFGPADPHGLRNGTFTHLGEPGVGGSVSFQDSLVLLCPANPQALVADAVTHARWYVASTGELRGRADAEATGGQVPAGDSWLGVTCYQGDRTLRPLAALETAYWAMKEEDGTGATVAGSAHQHGDATTCDPRFGAVPSQTGSASDYDFSSPVSFPNQW
jgi:hypothetical protein